MAEDTPRSSRRRTSTRPRRFGDSPPPQASPPVTPIAGSSKQGLKRKREDEVESQIMNQEATSGKVGENGEDTNDGEDEEEDPVWNDFSAEYYEVVEQLPLELHRNFALLRELDDQTQRHTARLLELIRQYVSQRVRPKVSPSPSSPAANESGLGSGTGEGLLREPIPDVGSLHSASVAGNRGELSEDVAMGESGNDDSAVHGSKGSGSGLEQVILAEPISGQPNGTSSSSADLAQSGSLETAEAGPSATSLPIHVHTGEGGGQALPIVIAALADAVVQDGTASTAPKTLAFPSRLMDPSLENAGSTEPVIPSSFSDGPEEASTTSLPVTTPTIDPTYSAFPPKTAAAMKRLDLVPAARLLLPEIGRLARETLRSADEKVGVATGVYNSVDRHIRALDIALEAQQVALNLGIREDTLPSNAIEMTGGAGAKGGGEGGEGEDGEMTIGMGGGAAVAVAAGTGGGKNKGKKGRKKNQKFEEKAQPPGPGPVVVAQYDLKVDPYEPRYCYCGGYSFGVMIACDASDCPNGGWIHLACQGLAKPPPGAFFCNDCRPVKKKK